jgi:hypothetical protein
MVLTLEIARKIVATAQQSPARTLAQKGKWRHYDWTQDARRGSSDIDNLGNVCTCAGSNLRTGSF